MPQQSCPNLRADLRVSRHAQGREKIAKAVMRILFSASDHLKSFIYAGAGAAFILNVKEGNTRETAALCAGSVASCEVCEGAEGHAGLQLLAARMSPRGPRSNGIPLFITAQLCSDSAGQVYIYSISQRKAVDENIGHLLG